MSDTEVTEAPPAIEAGKHQRILDGLGAALGDLLVESVLERGDLWVRVEASGWHAAIEACQRKLGLTHFVFLSGIDWQPAPNLSAEKTFSGEEGDEDEDVDTEDADADADADAAEAGEPAEMAHGITGGATRFQVFCRLYDTGRHVGVTLKADLDSVAPTVDTVVDLFRGADWHEREAWEMFGFAFAGHPGLRHLYLPGEFEGHPLRKDFPLLAREVKPWPGLVNVEQIPDHLDPKKIEEARQAQLEAAGETEVPEPETTPEAETPPAEADQPKADSPGAGEDP